MKTIWFVTHATTLPKYAMRMRTNNLAKYLAGKGYHVEIFSASTVHNTDINLIEDNKTLFIENDIDGVIYNSVRTSNYSGNGLKRILNMIQFPFRFLRVAKKKTNKADVIISNPQSIFGVVPYYVSRMINAKFITEVRDLWPESIVAYKGFSRKNIVIRIMYYFERWIYKHADSIVFTMEGGKDYIKDQNWERCINLDKIHHINNGVDLTEFKKNKNLYRLEDPDLKSDKYRVVYTGSIRRANNIKKIVDVAEIINRAGNNNIEFLIYGDGPDREDLETYCVKNNISNVKFKGFVEKKYIPSILSNANLNIMHFDNNSIKKYGASLNKMFEYFASERPILSDCLFGYDLIEKYQCGIVIDDPSTKIFADEIIKFSNINIDEYNKFCENAKLAAKDYDYKKLAEKYSDIISL